jgi:hypothetical protein
MGMQVCTGATLQCSFGMAPSTLVAIPKGPGLVNATSPAATVMDNLPMANVPPFGACSSMANPVVAAATAAALGALTPMPCVPAPAGPWMPGSLKVRIGGLQALESSCKLICSWGGVIQIVVPGQLKVMDT